jgi:hypothetical protein
MMPDLSCRHPRVSGKALVDGTKRKRSGSLGLTEPSHHNFPEYSNLRGFFTLKMRFGKIIRYFCNCRGGNDGGGMAGDKKTAAIARSRC